MSHRPAELRSIALHRCIARMISEDDVLVARALDRVDGWIRDGGPVHASLADRWRQLLVGPRDVLLVVLVEDTAEAVELRQVTPFAGVVDSRERWRILREVG